MQNRWKNITNLVKVAQKSGVLSSAQGTFYKKHLNFLLNKDKRRDLEQKTGQKPMKRVRILENNEISIPGDEDLEFFRSLLPTLSKMDDDQKLDFRTEVLLALKKAEENNEKYKY